METVKIQQSEVRKTLERLTGGDPSMVLKLPQNVIRLLTVALVITSFMKNAAASEEFAERKTTTGENSSAPLVAPLKVDPLVYAAFYEENGDSTFSSPLNIDPIVPIAPSKPNYNEVFEKTGGFEPFVYDDTVLPYTPSVAPLKLGPITPINPPEPKHVEEPAAEAPEASGNFGSFSSFPPPVQPRSVNFQPHYVEPDSNPEPIDVAYTKIPLKDSTDMENPSDDEDELVAAVMDDPTVLEDLVNNGRLSAEEAEELRQLRTNALQRQGGHSSDNSAEVESDYPSAEASQEPNLPSSNGPSPVDIRFQKLQPMER
jgi:hypothetical protein